jgi:hypothetical protein
MTQQQQLDAIENEFAGSERFKKIKLFFTVNCTEHANGFDAFLVEERKKVETATQLSILEPVEKWGLPHGEVCGVVYWDCCADGVSEGNAEQAPRCGGQGNEVEPAAQ